MRSVCVGVGGACESARTWRQTDSNRIVHVRDANEVSAEKAGMRDSYFGTNYSYYCAIL